METQGCPRRGQGQALEGGQALDQGLAPAGQLGALGGLLLLQIGELGLQLVQRRLCLPGRRRPGDQLVLQIGDLLGQGRRFRR